MNNDGRRHLDPVHTTRYVHIPHLREKLEWLYGYHPLIKSQERRSVTFPILSQRC
jgi:DNA-binding response OmpR family regulator